MSGNESSHEHPVMRNWCCSRTSLVCPRHVSSNSWQVGQWPKGSIARSTSDIPPDISPAALESFSPMVLVSRVGSPQPSGIFVTLLTPFLSSLEKKDGPTSVFHTSIPSSSETSKGHVDHEASQHVQVIKARHDSSCLAA